MVLFPITIGRVARAAKLYKKQNGPVAEWLGSALQKLLQRFESARDLDKRSKPPLRAAFLFFISDRQACLSDCEMKNKKSKHFACAAAL